MNDQTDNSQNQTHAGDVVKGAIGGAVVGLAAGAAAVVLSNQDTREQLKETADEFVKNVQERLDAAHKQIEEIKQKIDDQDVIGKLEKARDDIAAKVMEIRGTTEDKVSELRAKIEAEIDNLQEEIKKEAANSEK